MELYVLFCFSFVQQVFAIDHIMGSAGFTLDHFGAVILAIATQFLGALMPESFDLLPAGLLVSLRAAVGVTELVARIG